MDDSWTLDLHDPDVTGRLLAGSGALMALCGAGELLLRHWPGAPPPGSWPAVALGCIALAIGLILLGAAMTGGPQSLTVDPRAGALYVTRHLPFAGVRRRRIPFARIATVIVADHDDSDAAHPLRLCLIQHGARWPVCLATRPAARRSEIEALAARLRASIQPRACPPSSCASSH